MAHKWERLDRKYQQCANCSVVQHKGRKRDTFGRLSYFWTPKVGRCTINAKPGRKPIEKSKPLAGA